MSARGLMKIRCELLRREPSGPPDPYGTPGWVEVVEGPEFCELQPQDSSEEQGGALQVSLYRIFLPEDAPLRGWDAVRTTDDGRVYELDGDAALWVIPRNSKPSHVEAQVRRVE